MDLKRPVYHEERNGQLAIDLRGLLGLFTICFQSFQTPTQYNGKCFKISFKFETLRFKLTTLLIRSLTNQPTDHKPSEGSRPSDVKKLIDISRPLFLYFCLFDKHITMNNCSIKVADDWIRTQVLWYRKRPRCQMCHNQLWARYLEGDNISTKIGSGRVEIEIGEASPIF